MAILAECPMCQRKQSNKNKICAQCGNNMDKSKQSRKVRYWINYRLPAGKQRRESVGVFKDLDPYSITDAKAALAKRQVQRRERRIFDMLPESEMTFDELGNWYLNLKSVRKLASFDRYEDALSNFTKAFGTTFLGDIKQTNLEEYQIERKEQGAADATIDYEIKIAQAAVKSYMEAAGVGEARRDAILGHSKKGMDAHYLFVSDESLRQGMDQYTAWLDEQIDVHSQNVDHFVDQEAV